MRKEIAPGYETGDLRDRLDRKRFYRELKRTASGPKQITKLSISRNYILMDLEFLEVDLQLNQIHKRIDRLSDEAKKRVHTYPPTRKTKPACRNSCEEES